MARRARVARQTITNKCPATRSSTMRPVRVSSSHRNNIYLSQANNTKLSITFERCGKSLVMPAISLPLYLHPRIIMKTSSKLFLVSSRNEINKTKSYFLLFTLPRTVDSKHWHRRTRAFIKWELLESFRGHEGQVEVELRLCWLETFRWVDRNRLGIHINPWHSWWV